MTGGHASRLLTGAYLALFVIGLFRPGLGHAASPSLPELLEQEQLQASVTIESAPPYYQRAPVVVAVTVATPRWFSRGTRVRNLRVDQALWRPMSSFAENLSLARNGETWSAQRWRFRLYAQQPGRLTLPALQVFVSVDTAQHGVIEGDLNLHAPAIDVEALPGAPADSLWLATPSLSISEQWEGQRDHYQPGDALTRTRTFRVVDAPAMLIQEQALPTQAGVSLYQSPATLDDQSNRGRLTGQRVERLVVTLEKAGTYTLPGLNYHWYDTDDRVWRVATLDSFTVEVGAVAAEPVDQPSSLRQWQPNWGLVTAALIALAVLATAWRYREAPSPLALPAGLSRWQRQRRSRTLFRKAVAARDSARCLQLLFDALCETSPRGRSLESALGDDSAARQTLRRILTHAYAGDQPADDTGFPEKSAMEYLWRTVTRTRPTRVTDRGGLALNPSATPNRA